MKKKSAILVAALTAGVMFSSSVMQTQAVTPQAYQVEEVSSTGNYNYFNIVDGVKKYYHITPNSGSHYEIITGSAGSQNFAIKSNGGYDYYNVTPQGTSESRVSDFNASIGSESEPVVFHSIVNYGHGNAIYNKNNADNHSIYADFISNDTGLGNAYGGAIRNGSSNGVVATINIIDGDFINNKANSVGGAIAEQYVLQQFKTIKDLPVFYWANETSRAEIDFVIQVKSDVVPVEVKAETNLQAKSLKVYMEKFKPNYAIRTSMADYKKTDNLIDLPLYAIESIY